MSTVAITQPHHQVVVSSLCEAVSEHILADAAALQSDGGTQFSALIDGVLEAGIQNAFAVFAE